MVIGCIWLTLVGYAQDLCPGYHFFMGQKSNKVGIGEADERTYSWASDIDGHLSFTEKIALSICVQGISGGRFFDGHIERE